MALAPERLWLCGPDGLRLDRRGSGGNGGVESLRQRAGLLVSGHVHAVLGDAESVRCCGARGRSGSRRLCGPAARILRQRRDCAEPGPGDRQPVRRHLVRPERMHPARRDRRKRHGASGGSYNPSSSSGNPIRGGSASATSTPDRYAEPDRYASSSGGSSGYGTAAAGMVADSRSGLGASAPAYGSAATSAATSGATAAGGYTPGNSGYTPGANGYTPAGNGYTPPGSAAAKPAGNQYTPPAAAPAGGSDPNDPPPYRPGSTSTSGDLPRRQSGSAASAGALDAGSGVLPASYTQPAGAAR